MDIDKQDEQIQAGTTARLAEFYADQAAKRREDEWRWLMEPPKRDPDLWSPAAYLGTTIHSRPGDVLFGELMEAIVELEEALADRIKYPSTGELPDMVEVVRENALEVGLALGYVKLKDEAPE